MMVRTNQGGSILSFVIIGGIMALLLVGGAYFVRNTLVPSEQSGDPVAQQTEDEGDPGNSSEDEPDELAADDDAEPQTDDQTDEEAPEQPADEQLPVTGNQGDGGATPGNLPETGGVADVFFGGIMLSALAALMVVYRRSRALAASL